MSGGLRSETATGQENPNGSPGPTSRPAAAKEPNRLQGQSELAPSVREPLGEEKPAWTQALGVDPMADAEREMPLRRDRRSGERFRRHEHRIKRNHRILVAVDEQDGR